VLFGLQMWSIYGSIFECYLTYVKRHYGTNCIIVFDGYTNIKIVTIILKVQKDIGEKRSIKALPYS